MLGRERERWERGACGRSRDINKIELDRNRTQLTRVNMRIQLKCTEKSVGLEFGRRGPNWTSTRVKYLNFQIKIYLDVTSIDEH
jgi:hypothetical protein